MHAALKSLDCWDSHSLCLASAQAPAQRPESIYLEKRPVSLLPEKLSAIMSRKP
jgi:hypothetical protein